MQYGSVIILLMLAFGHGTPVHAQFVDAFGFRVGGSASTVVTNYHSLDYQPGFQFGAFVEILRGSILSVQVEAEYARRGFSSETEERDSQGNVIGRPEAKSTMDYIALPILARVRYPGNRPITPYLLAGPRFEYLIGRSAGVWEFSQIEVEHILVNHFADTNVSATIGTGITVPSPIGQEVRFEARLTEGLRDLLWEEGTDRARNRSFELSLGIAF